MQKNIKQTKQSVKKAQHPLLKEVSEGKYDSGIITRPFLQTVNKGPAVGWFITSESLDQIGMQVPVPESWAAMSREYQSGDRSDGFLITDPSFVILAYSPLLMNDTSDKKIMIFDKEVRDLNTNRYKVITKYLLFFTDEENRLIHKTPIQWSASGTAGFTFSTVHRKFRSFILQETQKQTGNKKGLGDAYYVNTILTPSIHQQIVGQGNQKSQAMVVDGFVARETVEDYFVHIDDCAFIAQMFEQEEEYQSGHYHVELQNKWKEQEEQKFQKDKKEDISDIFSEVNVEEIPF